MALNMWNERLSQGMGRSGGGGGKHILERRPSAPIGASRCSVGHTDDDPGCRVEDYHHGGDGHCEMGHLDCSEGDGLF